MHRLVCASFCATVCLATAAALAEGPGGEALNRPERPLGCDLSLPDGCAMSCTSPAGETVFVHTGMQGVLITELAGNHALVELQYANPADTVSVLVGDISRCAFKGAGDVELRPEPLPPRAAPRPVPPPSPGPPADGSPPPAAPPAVAPSTPGEVTVSAKTGGGGALSWLALLALALVGGIRRFAQVRP